MDTLVHESGPSQIEINLNHGDPLALADQAFMFKRAVRQVALKHGIHATFMAKPYQGQPGSSMHIHQNLVSTKTNKNLFSDEFLPAIIFYKESSFYFKGHLIFLSFLR